MIYTDEHGNETKGKVCWRCREEWPDDSEFYRKPSDKYCRACKYEVKKEQHERDPKRRKTRSSYA